MIIEKNRYRFKFMFVILIIILVILLFRLFKLQVLEGEEYSEIAANKMLQRIIIPAQRGEIYTNDGYSLATNRIGYSVEMYYTRMEEDKRNRMILHLTSILDKYGEEYDETFPIVLADGGNIAFTYELEEEQWKNQHDIPKGANAREALDLLRAKYHVKDNISDELALEAITRVHLNENIPIILQESEEPEESEDPIFTYEKQEMDWKKWHGFKEEEYHLTASQSLDKLRESTEIDEKYTNQEALTILAIREKIKNQGFRSWEPIQIARDISQDAMAQIVAHNNEMPGVSVTPEPIRHYPEGPLASHILGYISKVNETDVAERGYKMRDLKGAQGLEGAYESALRGEDGERLVVTDHMGRPRQDFTGEGNMPVSGNNIFLTMDYDLQIATEKALEETIINLQTGEEGRIAPNAKSGAAVVIDVNTGGVLAMASYPTYDPNLFSKGITVEDWRELNILTNDPLYPRPLYNNATMAALPSGSVFKMVPAVGALEEGKIGVSDHVYCGGQYPGYTGNRFRCWLRSGHGNENVTEALRDSCNIYFYEIGNRLGIDKLEEYVRAFGLGERTGIEISESRGIVFSKAAKAQSWMYNASNYIRNTIGITGNSVIINDNGEEQEVYASYAIAKEVFDTVDAGNTSNSNEVYAIVAETLREHNIRDAQHVFQIYQYVEEGKWTEADILNTSIGQGGNSFTPIQIANYVATLVNGGKNYKTHLVEKITAPDGEIIEETQPEIRKNIEIQPKNLEAIKQGMKLVTIPGGTGARDFLGFPHEEIGVGAKTGSAQYGSSDERDAMAWYTAFAPYEKPEIAVVAMIVEGSSGGYSGTVVRKIMDSYFGLEEEEEEVEEIEKKIEFRSIGNELNE